MPETADKYRNRARLWREKADTLPQGRKRDACLALAEGYANLASFIEEAEGKQACDKPDNLTS